MAFADDALGQRRFSRTYTTGRVVRLTLINKTGTVVVVGWERQQIEIVAKLESPAANIAPQNNSGEITIDLLRDNYGREVGSVNFEIRVPYTAIVDIETRIGNLSVSNIRSAFVRAHISSAGDIELTGMGSHGVVAENKLGDILFDGELLEGGTYRFQSMQGAINLRIPFNSSFKLMATAPSTRNISLGAFAGPDMSAIGDGRRIVGKFGLGSAGLTVTNQRGSISFIRR